MKKNGLRRMIAAALVMVAVAGMPVANVWAAPATENQESAVQSVTVAPKTLTLEKGKTAKLTASLTPNNAKNTITWSSSDSKVASVDKEGNVTAKAAGEAVITAKAAGGEKTDSCTVTVTKAEAPAALSAGTDGVAEASKVEAMLEAQFVKKASHPVLTVSSGSVKIPAGVVKDFVRENSKVQQVTFAVKASKPYTLTYTKQQIKDLRSKSNLSLNVTASETSKKSGSVVTLDVKDIPSRISPTLTLTVGESFANKTLELYADDMLVAKDLKVKRSSTPVVAGAYQPVVAAASKTNKTEKNNNKNNKPAKPAKTYYYYVEDIPISSGEYELRIQKSEDEEENNSSSSSKPSANQKPGTSSKPGTSTSNKPTATELRLDSKEVQMAVNGTYQFLVKGNQDTKNLKVTVSDPKIASVSLADRNDVRGARYKVKAKAAGTTDVKVTYAGKTATMKVTVAKEGSTPAITSKGSITLDTAQYQMAPGNQYTIGAVIRDKNGKPLTAEQTRGLVTSGNLKVRDSRTGSVVNLEQLSTGNFRVTGKNPGTCYIVYEIGGTHASVRIDVQKGTQARGSAVRNTSYFTR